MFWGFINNRGIKTSADKTEGVTFSSFSDTFIKIIHRILFFYRSKTCHVFKRVHGQKIEASRSHALRMMHVKWTLCQAETIRQDHNQTNWMLACLLPSSSANQLFKNNPERNNSSFSDGILVEIPINLHNIFTIMRPEHDVVSFRVLNKSFVAFFVIHITVCNCYVNVRYHRLTKYKLTLIVHNYGEVT